MSGLQTLWVVFVAVVVFKSSGDSEIWGILEGQPWQMTSRKTGCAPSEVFSNFSAIF